MVGMVRPPLTILLVWWTSGPHLHHVSSAYLDIAILNPLTNEG